MKNYIFYSVLILFLACSFNFQDSIVPERQWSQYRGHLSSGVLENANLPLQWNINKGENILWNIGIPGLGLSSPVIWGDKLFITTAVGESDKEGLETGINGNIGSVEDESAHEWKLYCINKRSGEVIWERVSATGIPEQKRHPKSTHANCTAATDGNYVVAFYGSEGLYCYDMDGNLIWEKDYGLLRSVFFRVETAEWEFASSPIIYDGKVIIQCDVMENSFVAAYDVATGKELWKMDRDEYPGWCTPNVYSREGRNYVAINGFKHRGGYDLETGEETWRMEGGGDIPIPTPVIGDGMIYFNSAHGPQSPILAIKNSAKGDISLSEGQSTNEYIQWSIPRGGSYMQTLLLYNGLIYNLGWNGRIGCYDALTGEEIYNEKLGRSTSFTASPVASDGRIFLASDKGEVFVIKSGNEFEILASNKLEDACLVTPAITEGAIYFRTQNGLIAVANK